MTDKKNEECIELSKEHVINLYLFAELVRDCSQSAVHLLPLAADALLSELPKFEDCRDEDGD